MNSSWAWPTAASGPASTASASIAIANVRPVMSTSSLSFVRKRPHPQLVIGELPHAGQAMGLDDQEQDDEGTEDHQLDLLEQADGQPEPDQMRRIGQEDGHQHDEGGAQEGAEDAAQAADDDHEQHQEREVDVEGQRLGAPEIEKH